MSDILDDRREASPHPSLSAVDESLAVPPPLPRRIPNLGHSMLLLVFAGLSIFAFELLAMLISGPPITMNGGHIAIPHPKLQLAAEGGAYLVTLVAAWLIFPLLWHRSFLSGLQWRWSAASGQAAKLLPLGVLLGVLSGVVNAFLTSSKPPPIEEFFASASDAWIITLFGIAIAPVFEEIFFRGFLIPAFAIAYDWLSLERSEAGRTRWRMTTTLSTAAYAFSAIVTSILFAALHGAQLAYALGPLAVLFSISMILSWVRVKTQSVAASILVHSAYNSFIFVVTIIGTGGYRHLDRMSH